MLISRNRKIDLFFIAILLFILSVGPSAIAQVQQQEVKEDFKDKELESFVKANQKVNAIQAEGETKMMQAIDESDLTVDRFNEILAAQQDPQRNNDATAEEMSSFNNVAQEIIKERQEMEVKMTQTIEEEGIDLDTYNMIMYAYQQSPEVQKRVNDLLED